MKFVLLFITVPSEAEAKDMARVLLKERLVASANIVPGAVSLYWWRGGIEEAEECVLLAKTRQSLAAAATKRAEQLHRYECPAILVLPVLSGSRNYLEWIADVTPE